MSAVPLNDDETIVFFPPPSMEHIRKLDNTERQQLLGRLITLADSQTPERYIEKQFSGCAELQQIRAGGYLRGYCRLITSVSGYNCLFVLGVTRHKYRDSDLSRYDKRAEEAVETINQLTSTQEFEEYIDDKHTFTAEDLRQLRDSL